LAPFNPKSGEFSPASQLGIILAKGSVVAGHMKLGQADADKLKKLEKYGINLAELPIGGPLTEDLNLNLQVEDGRMTILDNVILALPEYSIQVESGSWLNAGEDQHELHLQLVCGPNLEAILVEGIKQHVSENLVEPIRKALAKRFRPHGVRPHLLRPAFAPALPTRLRTPAGQSAERPSRGDHPRPAGRQKVMRGQQSQKYQKPKESA
jgi:hypothetical protein